MKAIHYPKGMKAPMSASSHTTNAGRGMALEHDLNQANLYYRDNDIAVIYKKPTPIQVVNVDYPARNKARISEAYYRTPSTTDYNGIYRGRYIDFEAKETKNKTSFPIQMIGQHQMDHLQRIVRLGGIGFFIIRFTHHQQTFLIDALTLIQTIETINRSSIPYQWFVQHGLPVQTHYRPRLAYLEVVDQYYFKEV